MEGVSYLINDKGERTHLVLDLSIWHKSWQYLKNNQLVEKPSFIERKPGFLVEAIEQDGKVAPDYSGDSLLEPMSEEELSEWYDNPIFPSEVTS